jgi:hypothetical protein
MKRLVIIAAVFSLLFVSPALAKTERSLEKDFDYTHAQWEKLITNLILLGKVEEGALFKRVTHYTSGYGKNKYVWYMFSISKRTNDPWSGIEVSFSKILYKDGPNGHKKVDWRRNVAFMDLDIDGFPDRYVRTLWYVNPDTGKLKIEYENVKEIKPETREYILWGQLIKELMKKEFRYYSED